MSAKNWRQCPRCLRRAEAERKEKLAAAEKAYGKIPSARFLRLNEEATKLTTLPDTLREDYEIGVGILGMFVVRYWANCEACGFGYEYKFETSAEPERD